MEPDERISVEEHDHVKTTLTDACNETICFKTKRNQTDKEFKRPIENKSQTSQIGKTTVIVTSGKHNTTDCVPACKEIRNTNDNWWIDKAAGIRGHTNSPISREFYDATTAIYELTQRQFVNITRQLHERMKGCVIHDGEQSGSFNINRV